jgi:hypothetical protein
MSFDNNLEGFNICQKMWYFFWNPSLECFTTRVPCHESHGDGFSCYGQAVALHAIADSVTIYKDLTIPIVDKAIKSTLKFRNPKYGAYSVDFHGGINSGDEDINYDDNAHLLRALIQLYEGTHNQKYLKMCKEIQNFMYRGIINHKCWKIPGCVWHISKPYMNAVSNSVAAIAAMRMIKYTENKEEVQKLYEFSKICVNFIWEKLRDPEDDVIMDGVGYDSEILDITKYSYNQGATLSAICLLYQYDHNPDWKDKAQRLADGATNPNKTLFDRDYDDFNKRFLHGVVYFNQLLIEGVVDFILTFEPEGETELIKNCKYQLLRHLSYYRKYCLDVNDGMYFMSFDIYKLDQNVYRRYINEFGGYKKYDPDGRERVGNMENIPVDQRPVAKSLIGQGAASHMFFQGARVFPKMNPSCP